MNKILLAVIVAIGLTGCATTNQHSTDVSADPRSPRVVYVNPHGHWIHDPWMRQHWHWGWHHRHGWGWHHPRYHHFHIQPLPHRGSGDQRRPVPAPVPRGEQTK